MSITRLYIPQDITLAELETQLDTLGELDSQQGRYAIARLQDKLESRKERQQKGRYSPDDVAVMLGEQQGLSADFFRGKVREGYASGSLRFWLADGTPADYKAYREGDPRPHEYYLGLDNEYTTKEAIDAWLEAWGAEYRFNGSSEQPKLKKTAYQAQLIIETLESLGYDPKKLPKANGKAGAKYRARNQLKIQLKNSYPFDAENAYEKDGTFDGAWKYLRSIGGIADA